MSGGGIIIQRAQVLLVAVTDPCLYNYLSHTTKAMVDAIDGKAPGSRTEADLHALCSAIQEALAC